jgi:hypothetical protein
MNMKSGTQDYIPIYSRYNECNIVEGAILFTKTYTRTTYKYNQLLSKTVIYEVFLKASYSL